MCSPRPARSCYKPLVILNSMYEFLNRFPDYRRVDAQTNDTADTSRPDRAHLKIQSHLIPLGRAEGCSVWVPPNDRNLSYRCIGFPKRTLDLLPNCGFEENTPRIV